MSPITITDIDKVEAWEANDSVPFTPGKHPAEIEAIEEKAASTGSPQIMITWRGVGPAAGCGIREWLVILPQTYGKVKAFLLAVKWELRAGTFSMPTTELVGRRAFIVVGSEQRDGKTFGRVMGHLPLTEGADVPIDTAGLPGDAQALPF